MVAKRSKIFLYSKIISSLRHEKSINFPWLLTKDLNFLDNPADPDFDGILEFGGGIYFRQCPRYIELGVEKG